MSYLPLLKYGLPLLVVALLGGGLWLQTARLKTCKAEKVLIEKNLGDCQAANAACAETIKKCTAETAQANELCGKRIKGKEATISKLKQIDALKGGPEDATDSTGDAILDALNRMQ